MINPDDNNTEISESLIKNAGDIIQERHLNEVDKMNNLCDKLDFDEAFLCSAKTGHNIDELINKMVSKKYYLYIFL